MSSKPVIPEIDVEEEPLRQEQRARIILWGTIGSSILLLVVCVAEVYIEISASVSSLITPL